MEGLKQLLNESEALEEVRRIINSAIGKKWTVAVWCVDEAEKPGEPNMLRLAGVTTWQFPIGDFGKSIDLLRNKLDEQAKSDQPAVPVPLEMAPFLLEGDGKKCEAESLERPAGADEKALCDEPKAETGLSVDEMFRNNGFRHEGDNE